MGTITPEGNASIYCYKCDDDVMDSKLAEHMKVLGINIATQEKTEKTITEMNLEANLNLTLSKVIDEGKVLIPLFGPGFTGMDNLGNSCYMNSVVQVLNSQPEIRDFYTEGGLEHLMCSEKNPETCFKSQMHKLVLGLASGEYS